MLTNQIASFDLQIYHTIALSLFVSLSASLLAAIVGIPLGLVIAYRNFRGKSVLLRLIYMFMSTPPVIAGLVIYLMFSRGGPLGTLGLLYTPQIMILAQFLLVLPIMIGQIYGHSSDKIHRIVQVGMTLGANPRQQIILAIRELQSAIVLSFALGFGRAMSEVGAVMLVGGNIKGKTRVMTTSIATLMGQGDYKSAIVFALVLLGLSFLIQTIVYRYYKQTKG